MLTLCVLCFDTQAYGCTKQRKLHSSDLRQIKKIDSQSNLLVVPFGPAANSVEHKQNTFTLTIHVKNRHLSLKIQSKDVNHIFMNTKC